MTEAKKWTSDEKAILLGNYAEGSGLDLCLTLLPDRTSRAVRHQAVVLGMKSKRGRGPGRQLRHGEHNYGLPMTNAALTAYWDAQPIDNREFAARLLGDPCPGRSALEMKEKDNA
jgi:hypothetical protein